MKYIILNAMLVDPADGKESRQDLRIHGGIITQIAPAGELICDPDAQLIHADGQYAFPGFVDFHTHLFRHGSTFGLDADKLISAGVVCATDMGSAGWVNYPAFHRCDLEGKRLVLKSYLNLSPIGQPGRGINEPLHDSVLDEGKMKDLLQTYPGEILGIKIRTSRSIVNKLGLEPLRRAVAIGERLNLQVCVHTTDPPASAAAVASILRPGDVYSHVYHGKGNHVLDERGNVQDGILDAKRRGVLMEVGNGRVNFSFPVAKASMRDGLFPDIISSDATPATFHQDLVMWDLPYVMSKFLSLGMPLVDVLRAVTVTPAKQLGLSRQLGTLAEGRSADVALCRMDTTPTEFQDSDGNTHAGPRGIVPVMVLRCGEIVYQESGK